MPGFEIMIRGGVIGLCLLVAAQMILSRKRHPAMIPGALFAAGIAIYTYLSSPVGRPWTPSQLPLIFISTLNPAFFWLFARALIDDRLTWDLPNIAAVCVIPLLFVATLFAPEPARTWIALGQQAATGLIFLSVAFLSLQDIGSDLVDKRRLFRFALAVLIPVTGLAVAAAEIIQISSPLPQWIYQLQSGALFVLTMLMAFWTLRVDETMVAPRPRGDRPAAAVISHAQAADQAEISRLRELVVRGVLFEQNMSVGLLAQRLKVPEHRLRRLINREMDYRNFAEFLNNHRIDEAKVRLGDPSRMREQIIQIAYSLGYASLAPFNKAFRERTGMSPTEFRDSAARAADRV
jgi:AraC-like DNA-binding protein